MAESILVSACLLGLNTRYDAKPRSHPEVEAFLARRKLLPIPVCPEQLAGLPTPRPSVEFTSGDGSAVLDGCGDMVSTEGVAMNMPFLEGAKQSLMIAKICGCREALLKERSPSCGSHTVYRNGEPVDGLGVTAALLQRNGINTFSEEDI